MKIKIKNFLFAFKIIFEIQFVKQKLYIQLFTNYCFYKLLTRFFVKIKLIPDKLTNLL